MKFFIVLGEDKMFKHATAKLVKQLKRLDTRAEFKDSGGLILNDENTGFQKHKPLKLRIAKKVIKEFKPDILILFGALNKERKIAVYAKRRGIKTCYYSLPEQSNKGAIARRVARKVDKVLFALPGQEQLYNSDTFQAEFVGNPLIDSIKDHEFDEGLILNPNQVNIAVLPSPNDKQLRKEILLVRRIAAKKPDYQFHIVLEANSASNIGTFLLSENMKVHAGKKYDILKHCNAAIVFSEVGSLEAAMLNCPHILIRNNTFRDRLKSKQKRISPVNQVLNREVVRALHKPDDILKELSLILSNQNYCAGIMADYQELKNRLGMERASYNAARIITEWLESGSS